MSASMKSHLSLHDVLCMDVYENEICFNWLRQMQKHWISVPDLSKQHVTVVVTM